MELKQLALPWVTKFPQPQSSEMNHGLKPSKQCAKINLSYFQVGLNSSVLSQLMKANTQSNQILSLAAFGSVTLDQSWNLCPLSVYEHHGDSVRVKWTTVNKVSVQHLRYKVVKPREGIVPFEPGKALRICKACYCLGWTFSWAVNSAVILLDLSGFPYDLVEGKNRRACMLDSNSSWQTLS